MREVYSPMKTFFQLVAFEENKHGIEIELSRVNYPSLDFTIDAIRSLPENASHIKIHQFAEFIELRVLKDITYKLDVRLNIITTQNLYKEKGIWIQPHL